MSTSNQKKFLNKNLIQRGLVGGFHRTFVKVINELQPKSILEVGCGEGYLLTQLYKHHQDIPLQGVDVNETALAEGHKLWPELSMTGGDIYHLAYADRSWDTVIASEVLEHLEEPEKALKELVRVSSRQVILSVPFEPWFRLGNLARGRHLKRLGNHPEHINMWSPGSFSRLVAKYATVERIIISFPWIIVRAKI